MRWIVENVWHVMDRPNAIPPLNKPQYKVYFYHSGTGEVMGYKFLSFNNAQNFFDKLDSVNSRPTMYVSERIM